MTDASVADVMSRRIAAVDLGSNSFHMMIAEELQGEIRTLERRGEKVQLAAGLNAAGHLSDDAIERGVACLAQFGQRLQGMDPSRVVVFATNALRAARNRQVFIDKAEAVLGYPIEVIAGREEARLIYLGVAHTQADTGQRLVVDIGGGSTEFIIGEGFDAKALESLHMGCVSFTKRFFADGHITRTQFQRAVAAATQELMNIKTQYLALGWQAEIGSSGTIRAVEGAIIANGWGQEGITAEALDTLVAHCLNYHTLDEVDLEGVKPDRRQVFIGGLAILTAVFRTLRIRHMRYSDGALREGALWDLIGREQHQDVRTRTLSSMQTRFHVDTEQAQRVDQMARAMYQQIYPTLGTRPELGQWLGWAACVHEIGLSIAHSGFHKHGAYLLQYADMPGFTRPGQLLLATLVRQHRRKIRLQDLQQLPARQQPAAIWLVRLLRLAVVLNHSREAYPVPVPTLSVVYDHLTLSFEDDWLADHPLTLGDLFNEVELQAQAGLTLTIDGIPE